MSKIYNSLGTMSGTSLDGIDVSILKTNGEDVFENSINLYCSFDQNLKKDLKNLKDIIKNPEDITALSQTKEFKDLENKITLLHIDLINEAVKKSDVKLDIIGFHGITLFHDAKKKFTFQMGDANLIKEKAGIHVVKNFRQNDLDHGGQGAPLTPIFHRFILGKQNNYDAIINIGGISNITYLKNNKLFATDIGPGNCLIDSWINHYFDFRFDENGKFSSIAKPDLIIANNFIDRFNFQNNLSFDANDFSISEFRNLDKNIGAATLTFITANLILTFMNEKKINKALLSGGGRKNKTIINYIEARADNIEQLNFDGDFIESQAFAYLAVRSLLKLPLSFPETTGVSKPVSGGEIVN
jgi:anhydro-N-acetylmuramic acid kinase